MIVLKFGVRKILNGEECAVREMRDAHRLYNCLVAIERWRRREFATIRSRHVPGLSEIDAAYEQLSEWIGEHAGVAGKRGEIREKRRAASAAHDPIRPTKKVDASAEVDTIAELKAWRKAAGEHAKPLRERFDLLLKDARQAYEARTRGVDLERIVERDAMRSRADKEESEALSKLSAQIDAESRKTHAKAAANARVLEEMLQEPQWSAAWRDIARLDDAAHRLRQWVAEAHHLNHGTYVAVHDAVEQAGQRPRPRPDGEPRRPKERPMFSVGRLRKMGWQLQGVITWGDVIEGKCRDVIISDMRPTGRQWRAKCRIRITTAERGVNEWVELDIVGRRKIPGDTRVRWVYLVPQSRPYGRHEFEVQFTAEPTSPLIVRAPGTGHAKIHLMWTQEQGTITVAHINGAPLRLPSEVPRRIHHAEYLRGVGDKYFDLAREEVVARTADFDERIRAEAQNIAQWRRHAKLHRLSELLRESIPNDRRLEMWAAWRDHRLAAQRDLFAFFAEYAQWAVDVGISTEEIFPLWLETWRRKDKHLVLMEDGTRRRAVLCRREFYRVTAAKLCTQYETFEFDGAVDLEALALRDKSEDKSKELHQAARHNRVIACVSELKAAIQYTFGKERERSGAREKPVGARSSNKQAKHATAKAIAPSDDGAV